MPRCLMAKKWKAYPWQDRAESTVTNQQITEITDTVQLNIASNIDTIATSVIEEDEEIDVVGDSPAANASATVVNNNNNNNNTSNTSNTSNSNDTNSSSTSNSNSSSNSTNNNGCSGNIDTQHTNSTVIVGKTSVIPTCWGPSSPTAGTTAEEAHSSEGATRGSTILYNGKYPIVINQIQNEIN